MHKQNSTASRSRIENHILITLCIIDHLFFMSEQIKLKIGSIALIFLNRAK